VAAEVDALRRLRPAAIVADIPPLAFDVAAAIGVPSLAIGNFSWDWIYTHLGSPHPEVDAVVASIQTSERRATLLLRLPFHDEMEAFPRQEDVPLLANVSGADRGDTRRRLGLAQGRPVVLLSYGGFALQRLDPARFGAVPDVTFVTTTLLAEPVPDNLVILPLQSDGYQELLAACDAVMMKPGYGTVADCMGNRVPMIYTRRAGFAEEAVLVDAMERYGRAVSLAADDLFAGRIRPAIEHALALQTPWAPMRLDGAALIARRILQTAGLDGFIERPGDGERPCDESAP
jgi:L-arabinokinase